MNYLNVPKKGRMPLLKKALNLVKEGMILEFGVSMGTTISEIAKTFPNRKVYGFDSFKGLPEDWILSKQNIIKKGTYQWNPNTLDLPENVQLEIGLFEETLPDFKRKIDKIAFIHMDCDLYSSTKTVLSELENFIDGETILLFDEYWNIEGWANHEHKAFMEFLSRNEKIGECLLCNNDAQVAFRVRGFNN
jgi:hypothetical protein